MRPITLESLRILRLRDIVQVILLTLIAGWLIALISGVILAQIQTGEIAHALPAEHISGAVQARLDYELRRGMVLLLVQVGVISTVLAWQVGVTAYRTQAPQLHGIICGAALTVIYTVAGGILQIPLIFNVILAAALLSVGLYAGWSADGSEKKAN